MKKGLALIAAALVVAACDENPFDPPSVDDGLETLRDATEQYQDVQAALDDGFVQVEPCTANPDGPGALGIPYLAESRLDTTIDLENPEVLFYEEQANGDLELVGVEIVVPIDAWEAENDEPPTVLGEDLHRNEDAGLFGIHIWIWRDNPDGDFAFWHPDVYCQPAEADLETLRQATEQYEDVAVALDDGFVQVEPCTANPEGPGALGIPYLEQSRLDTTIDIENPEVLFYERQENGELELVGVEVVVPIEAWDEMYDEPPTVLGQELHRNEDAGLYGIHIWLYRDNPEGLFAFWHPDVSCAASEGLETVRQATEQYQDVQVALDDGFAQVESCTVNPEGPGALGIPYLAESRLDTTLDLENPEVLFYEEQENGDLVLVGAETVVPIDKWDEMYDDPPTVLGQELHRNEEAGLYGIHIWVWRENPEGAFAFWHPDVSCEYGEG